MKVSFTAVTFVLFMSLITGCANISKEQGGTGFGALIGGVVGSQFGGGAKILATALGVGAGALIGNRIGKYLDDQDKQKLATATVKTAETGKSQSIISSNSGATMRTTTVSAPVARTPSSTNRTAAIPEDTCKTVRQTIILKSGARQQEDVKVCRGTDGWEVVGG